MQLSSTARLRYEPPASFAIVKQDTGLARVLRPELNVCIWRRSLPPRLERWLTALSRTLVHELAARISPDLASARRLFAGLPDRAETRAWAADVVALAARFCDLLGTKSLRASLATVETNKCRKFHTDYKTLRLVCTYAGPGTETRGSFATAQASSAPVPATSWFSRGGLFAGNEGRGAVHRSPPIEHTGERRIVLTFDQS